MKTSGYVIGSQGAPLMQQSIDDTSAAVGDYLGEAWAEIERAYQDLQENRYFPPVISSAE